MSRWNLCVSLLSPTADGEEKCSEWHKAGVPGEARGAEEEGGPCHIRITFGPVGN